MTKKNYILAVLPSPDELEDICPDPSVARALEVSKAVRTFISKQCRDWSVRVVFGLFTTETPLASPRRHYWNEIYIPEDCSWWLVDHTAWQLALPLSHEVELRQTDWKEEHLDRFHLRHDGEMQLKSPPESKPKSETYIQDELHESHFTPEQWARTMKELPYLDMRKSTKLRPVEMAWLIRGAYRIFGGYSAAFDICNKARRTEAFEALVPNAVESYLKSIRKAGHNVAAPANV